MNPHTIDPATLTVPGLSQATSEVGSNSTPLENRGQQGKTEEFAYDPVPPKRSVTISVRCRIRGRGQPLPYPVDEGDGE